MFYICPVPPPLSFAVHFPLHEYKFQETCTIIPNVYLYSKVLSQLRRTYPLEAPLSPFPSPPKVMCNSLIRSWSCLNAKRVHHYRNSPAVASELLEAVLCVLHAQAVNVKKRKRQRRGVGVWTTGVGAVTRTGRVCIGLSTVSSVPKNVFDCFFQLNIFSGNKEGKNSVWYRFLLSQMTKESRVRVGTRVLWTVGN